MAAKADDRGIQRYCPQGKKHRRKRKEPIWVNVVTCMILAAFLVVAGVACGKGLQLLWSGVENVLDILISEKPVDAILGGGTSESESGDRTAPVLSGVHDFILYQGDTIAYMSGVTASDDIDANPRVAVDSSSVDLTCPGVYPVLYTATDSSGNSTRESATVTVLEKLEGYVELDDIYAAADAKLEQILGDNTTRSGQVRDVYAWARLNLSYGGHSDRADWLQTAYEMLTVGKGDCFGYWAVTKLLFERLEIPNIDVQKVKNAPEDTEHFWSMVSLDGGQTWYHFDSTPRYGEGDDFCLVTDAFLDAYSESHEGSHNRDKSLYPETP